MRISNIFLIAQVLLTSCGDSASSTQERSENFFDDDLQRDDPNRPDVTTDSTLKPTTPELMVGTPTIEGQPTGYSNRTYFTVRIGGENIVRYRFALGPDNYLCDSDSIGVFSDYLDIDSLIHADISSMPDGPIKLCVAGISHNYLQTEITETVWIKDTVPPDVTFSTSIPVKSNHSLIPIDVTFSEEVVGFTEEAIAVQNGSIRACPKISCLS